MSGRIPLLLVSMVLSAPLSAATGTPRIALSLRGLEGASEVVYHPHRWLAIRRSIAFVRAEPVDDIVRSVPTLTRRPHSYALTGDVHPFGGPFRISLGLREDDNLRLLRSSNDRAAISTARYAPLMTVGFAARVGAGLTIGGDIGLVGRSINRAGDSQLMTPVDLPSGGQPPRAGHGHVVQLAIGYGF